VVMCLERGADLHMAQLMPLPLTVSCFSKVQIGFTFLVPAYPGSPGKRAVKRVYVCMLYCTCTAFVANKLHQLIVTSGNWALGNSARSMIQDLQLSTMALLISILGLLPYGYEVG